MDHCYRAEENHQRADIVYSKGMRNRYKTLIRDTGIFALGACGAKLIVFLLLPLYTHVLSSEQYGVADFIFTLGQLMLPVFSLAIFNGLLRYGLMNDIEAADALCCATRVFAIGSIVTVILTPLCRFIPDVSEWRWYLCFYIISAFAVINSLIYLKVKDKNSLYALLSVLQAALLVICNLIFLLGFKLGIGGYLLSYIVSNVITVICVCFGGGIVEDLRHAQYSRDLMKSMILFSMPYILNDISWWAIHSSNKLMIKIMLGSAMLGLYTIASKIPLLINVAASIFLQAWGLASIREYDSSNDTSFYSKVFNYFVIIMFGGCIFMVSIIKYIMKIYVSEEFFIAWQFIPVLLFCAVFLSISAFAGSLLGAMKKSQSLMWSTLFAGIANVSLNILLIPVFGLWGAAAGTLIANIIVAVSRLVSVRRYLKIDYQLHKNIPLVCIALLQMVLVSSGFSIGIVSCCAVILYGFLVYKDVAVISKMVYNRLKI